MSLKIQCSLLAFGMIFLITDTIIQYPTETREFLSSREMILAYIGLLWFIADYMVRKSKIRILVDIGFILILGAMFLFVWQGFYLLADYTEYFLDEFNIDIPIEWREKSHL